MGFQGGTAARFMESPLFETDLLTGHEPEKAEGGLRLRTRLRLRREPRFMESPLFETDLLTDLEPGRIPGGRDAPLYGRRDARRYGGEVHGKSAGLRGAPVW